MPTFGIRENAWNQGTRDQKKVVRRLPERLDLGPVDEDSAARFQTAGAVVWLISDDDRFELRDSAIYARVLSLLVQFDVLPDGTKSKLIERAKTWVGNHGGLIIPDTIPDGEDPYYYTYQLNNGPAFAGFWNQVPPELTPVSS